MTTKKTTTQFRLNSSPLVHTPGLVRWAQAAEPRWAARFLRQSYPGLTPAAVKALLAGRFTVEGDDVVVVVEG